MLSLLTLVHINIDIHIGVHCVVVFGNLFFELSFPFFVCL